MHGMRFQPGHYGRLALPTLDRRIKNSERGRNGAFRPLDAPVRTGGAGGTRGHPGVGSGEPMTGCLSYQYFIVRGVGLQARTGVVQR
jgi:hypothetical protein